MIGVLTSRHHFVCTCEDSVPSLEAAVEALMGHVIPTARLPVPIPLYTWREIDP
jgi:hypothetical protein